MCIREGGREREKDQMRIREKGGKGRLY